LKKEKKEEKVGEQRQQQQSSSNSRAAATAEQQQQPQQLQLRYRRKSMAPRASRAGAHDGKRMDEKTSFVPRSFFTVTTFAHSCTA